MTLSAFLEIVRWFAPSENHVFAQKALGKIQCQLSSLRFSGQNILGDLDMHNLNEVTNEALQFSLYVNQQQDSVLQRCLWGEQGFNTTS